MIIDIPIQIQVDGIIDGKRKGKIYNVNYNFPCEVREVSFDDLNIVSLEIKDNHIQPTYAFEGKLYQPAPSKVNTNFIINDTLNKVLSNISESIGKDEGGAYYFKSDDYEVVDGPDIKDYKDIQWGAIDSLPNALISNFNKIESNNIDFKGKFAKKYADMLLIVDGKIYEHCQGLNMGKKEHRCFLTHEKVSKNYLRDILNTMNYNLSNLVDSYPNTPHYRYLDLVYPYSMHNFFGKQKSIEENTQNEDYSYSYMNFFMQSANCNHNPISIILLDNEKLHEATYSQFGKFIFDSAFIQIKKIMAEYNNINKSEFNISTWLKAIENEYNFGPFLIKNLEECLNSNFELNTVMETMSLFSNYLDEAQQSNRSGKHMQQYIQTEISEKNQSRTLPADYIIFSQIDLFIRIIKSNLKQNNTIDLQQDTIAGNSFSFYKDLSGCIMKENNLISKM